MQNLAHLVRQAPHGGAQPSSGTNQWQARPRPRSTVHVPPSNKNPAFIRRPPPPASNPPKVANIPFPKGPPPKETATYHGNSSELEDHDIQVE